MVLFAVWRKGRAVTWGSFSGCGCETPKGGAGKFLGYPSCRQSIPLPSGACVVVTGACAVQEFLFSEPTFCLYWNHFFVRSKGFLYWWGTYRANKKHRPTTMLSGRSVLRLWTHLSGQYRALWAFRDTARIRKNANMPMILESRRHNPRGLAAARGADGPKDGPDPRPGIVARGPWARFGSAARYPATNRPELGGVGFGMPRGPILVVLKPPAPPPAPGTQGRAFTRVGSSPPQGCPGAPPDRRGWSVRQPGGAQDDFGGGSARWRHQPPCFGG